MNKDYFDNDPMLKYVLQNFDISSKQAFEASKEIVYEKLKEKPILTGIELMSLPEEPDNYIIEKLVWKRDIVIVLASEKAGKSILGIQMACALTKGGHFLSDFEVPDALKVLYVQAEGSREETQTRLRSMTKNESSGWNPENFYHMYPPSIALDTDDGYNSFMDAIYKTDFKPDVIFIDPLYMAMRGDLIDNKAARLFCINIRKMKEIFDCTIIINHHKRRPQREKNGSYVDRGDDEVMGSFVWKAFASHIFTLSNNKDNIRNLSCTTQRSGNVVKGITLQLIEPENLHFEMIDEPYCENNKEKVIECLKLNKEGLSADITAKKLTMSQAGVRKAFSSLSKEGKIFKVNPGKRPTLYALAKGV
jgi:RecA-family ATPase